MRFFGSDPIHGEKDYARGYRNGKSFTERHTDVEIRKQQYREIAPAQDDYDRGFLAALDDARRTK